ncbi:dienelactone hydrolase [Leptolyngbya sp. Heron Island J]|uniref:alpha/beta hydrolase n=1 Tax=Leptolyngbya sp. Heron Island J TaxID=1385935 RepID=UPI0003B9AFDC|nr:alpha/beta hydrolase [Leptolyngbya sp. Heron Island J]ESA39024.1 dienelactone hydrolase [Leptolyngbya sp. Heron Island J]
MIHSARSAAQSLWLAQVVLSLSGLKLRQLKRWRSVLWAGAVAVGVVISTPVQAAERVNIQVGPIKQTLYVSDLEEFARTGQVPSRLQLYQSILTPELRTMLNNRVVLDPDMADRMVADILASPNGELLLDSLSRVAPDLTVEQIREAIRLAAKQTNGLSMLGVLRAVPQETLDIDLTAALALASQLNLSRLEGDALSSVLEQELLVSDDLKLPTDIDPTQGGPFEVTQRSFRFVDSDRNRLIPLDMYVPAAAVVEDAPLVVLSHGFAADRRFLTYIGQHLASYGLTVVALEHVGSNVDALNNTPLDPAAIEEPSRILPASEFLDRPRDVTYLLDRLAWMEQVSPMLRGKFDTDQVVLIGHSLGGYTGFALAGAQLDLSALPSFCASLTPVGLSPADWLQCAAVKLPEVTADLSDPRITQVIAMNPLIGRLFGRKGLADVAVPSIILTGTKDGVTPTLAQQLGPFNQLSGPDNHLIAVIGGTHLSVGDPENVNVALTQIPFMPELSGEQSATLREYLRALSLSVAMQQTDQAEVFRVFLEPAYAQQFSTGLMPLRMTQRLPESVQTWLRTVAPEQARAEGETLWSWMHLKTLDARKSIGGVQRRMMAYLRQEQVSITVLYWPMGLPWI